MISANERLKILQNILARGGDIGEIDLHSEMSKSLSAINGYNASKEIANMQRMAQMPLNNDSTGAISPEMGQSATQDPNALNQPMSEGNGTLNLPPNM
jgi:hypothetical protein